MAAEQEREFLDQADRELAGSDVPRHDEAHIDQRRANALDLITASPGVLLSDLDFGDELIIETDKTPHGHDGYLAVTLVPWGEQYEIPLGVPVRAAVDDTNIPSLQAFEDVYMYGSALTYAMNNEIFHGQVRAQCNLLVSPLTFTAFEGTIYADFPDDEIPFFIKRGVLEYRSRGYYEGYMVGVSLQEPPVIVPWVRSVSVIDKLNERALPLEWKSPHYLTAKTCIIDTDES